MGRYTGPNCRLCRTESMKLFLKGDKCYSNCVIDKTKAKGAVRRRSQRPPSKMSGYGKHLREKQKGMKIAGVREAQYRNYFRASERVKGQTGETMLIALERRLDSVVYLLGFTPSKKFARQLITHGHITVNGTAKKIPAYSVKVGDKVALKAGMQESAVIKKALAKSNCVPGWLTVDKTKFAGEILSIPTRQQISYNIDESLIVEFYKK